MPGHSVLCASVRHGDAQVYEPAKFGYSGVSDWKALPMTQRVFPKGASQSFLPTSARDALAIWPDAGPLRRRRTGRSLFRAPDLHRRRVSARARTRSRTRPRGRGLTVACALRRYWIHVDGLANNTLYDYYIEATDAAGNVKRSDIFHVWIGA